MFNVCFVKFCGGVLLLYVMSDLLLLLCVEVFVWLSVGGGFNVLCDVDVCV